jgi:hypothetical protein
MAASCTEHAQPVVMTEQQLKSLIKAAILELLEERRDLFRDLLREALLDEAGATHPVADGERADEAAKREEILKLIGTTI